MLEEMLALAASEGMVQDKISEHYRSLIASDNLFVGNRLVDICISEIFNEKNERKNIGQILAPIFYRFR
jgi:hypothetical protein